VCWSASFRPRWMQQSRLDHAIGRALDAGQVADAVAAVQQCGQGRVNVLVPDHAHDNAERFLCYQGFHLPLVSSRVEGTRPGRAPDSGRAGPQDELPAAPDLLGQDRLVGPWQAVAVAQLGRTQDGGNHAEDQAGDTGGEQLLHTRSPFVGSSSELRAAQAQPGQPRGTFRAIGVLARAVRRTLLVMHVSPLRRERRRRGWSLERAAAELCKVAAEHGLGSLAVDGTTLGRYERGTIHFPREPVPEAMALLYGQPIYVLWPEQAWYEVEQDAGITDLDRRALLRLLGGTVGIATLTGDDTSAASGPSPAPDLSGIWLSRYVYYSDGRGQEFEGRHYVVLSQEGSRLTGHSLPHTSESELTLELLVEGSAVSGVWKEKTSPDGYYQGATYTGALHLLLAPTGKAMTEKWLGFGRDLKINTGDWQLRWVDEAAKQEQYHLAV
jgi:hypothetical protein